jgi:hypothetical protein
VHRKRPRLREAPAVLTSPLLAGRTPALTTPHAGAGRSVLRTSRAGTLDTAGGRKAPGAPAARGVPLPTGGDSDPFASRRGGGTPVRSASRAGG